MVYIFSLSHFISKKYPGHHNIYYKLQSDIDLGDVTCLNPKSLLFKLFCSNNFFIIAFDSLHACINRRTNNLFTNHYQITMIRNS